MAVAAIVERVLFDYVRTRSMHLPEVEKSPVRISSSESWLFQPLTGDITARAIWTWWVQRQYVYNLALLSTALVSFFIFTLSDSLYARCFSGICLLHSNGYDDGDLRFIFALAVMLSAILLNLAYLVGALVDTCLSNTDKSMGPMLFKIYLSLSCVVAILGAVEAVYL
ncbi:MAG TPA: hypothetical protein V6C76_15055 [Drouetiella sp.]